MLFCLVVFFKLLTWVFVDGLYFPASVLNITLPDLKSLERPIPPLTKLLVASEGRVSIRYSAVSETSPFLFTIEEDSIRFNEDFLSQKDIISKRESVAVSAWSVEANPANATINLILTGDKINCERAKRNLCFWDGVSYRVLENERPTQLSYLSSHFYAALCKNYSLSYKIVKGEEFVKATLEENTNHWMLTTRKKIKRNRNKIRFGVDCSVTSAGKVEVFQREFDLEVLREENLQILFDVTYKPLPSNIVYEKEKLAAGIINDPGGVKIDRLKFTIANDTEENLDLKCLPKTAESFSRTYVSCEVTARKTMHLKAPYVAFVQIEDTLLPQDDPKKYYYQNITLIPKRTEPEKQSLTLSSSLPEDFMLDLKYPELVLVSRRAVVGTRVAEPTISGIPPSVDSRKKIEKMNIKFKVLSSGPFNVSELGGIVFVSNRNQLRDPVQRIKITGIHPNGYRFFSTLQINVTNTKSSFGEESCDKPVDENNRLSCSEKRFKSECERTCGVSTGILKQSENGPPVAVGCSWRSNEKPEKLSRLYQTCSPDLLTCPDRHCDQLEALFPKICPQDCAEYVFGSANKESHVPGIASATGVCTCDNRQKCLCALVAGQNERKKAKQNHSHVEVEDAIRHREVISAVKASYTDQCGTICLLSIVGGTLAFVSALFAVFLVLHRRRIKKRCLNQRPLKEDMVDINYEEYVERPGDALRPLSQTATVKEIPEYYDKKWEFPRHRLTIEETLGEGEFGKVLKARADGIGGNDGPITVAVKTLKENAKDTELADLISEYQLLKEIDHPNVIHLLGACTKYDGPVYIIIEYAEHGSLRNYLRKHRHNGLEKPNGTLTRTVTPKDILTFAWQIAKGMNYLTEMKLVHRDLAARNVLVAEGLICKISDFGLTRDIYEDDTYLKRSKGRVPVKWMALESLADHIYTTKSDVWSYGVVLWELVTTGASPYPGIAGQNLFHLLKSGYRMEKPSNCSNELYQILRSCWQENPSHRPTFKSLVIKFEDMLGEGKDYLDLNPRTVENKTYFGEFLKDDPDEGEAFLPMTGRSDGIFGPKFEMFENPKKCSKCQLGVCKCENGLRYENECVGLKRKYENGNLEDTGYVQPRGDPRPVNFIGFAAETIPEDREREAVYNENLNAVPEKKEIFEVNKV